MRVGRESSGILEADLRTLRDEHAYAGGITIVKDYVRAQRLRHREVFVPLRHDPGHAQVDFGEALAEIAGVERKIHFFTMDLPHSDACFVRAYPPDTAEAFCDGHNAAFEFFDKVPRSILYDNTKLAVARILGDGVRQRTRVFSALQSHYVFADRFGRPGKGSDKGKVEGLIGWIRRNLLVPVPRAVTLMALNEQLLEGCRRRLGDRLGGHGETIGERLVRDLEAFHCLPPAPYDACEKKAGRDRGGPPRRTALLTSSEMKDQGVAAWHASYFGLIDGSPPGVPGGGMIGIGSAE
jgi:transposase